MTRAVLFDFYGTLARAVTWGPTFEDVLASRGLELTADAKASWTAEVADGVEHVEHSVDRDRYVAWEHTRLARLVTACGAAPADVEATVAALYAAQKDFTLAAYDDVADVLAVLRARGITVAICSNWDWDLDQAVARTGLTDVVDAVVSSAWAGARKPHPRIFRYTLERCGRPPPAETVFVGDTWEPDVVGPASFGMRPVHLWRGDFDREKEPPAREGVPRIPDLAGLLGYL